MAAGGRLRARIGGWLAVGVSVFLLGFVFGRDVGLNVLNGWTIAAGAAGGLMAVARPRPAALFGAEALLVLAMLPAMVGGLGLLYVPSLILIFPLRRPRGALLPRGRP